MVAIRISILIFSDPEKKSRLARRAKSIASMATVPGVRISSRQLSRTLQRCDCNPFFIFNRRTTLHSRRLSLWPKFLKPNTATDSKDLKEEKALAQALETANQESQAKLNAKHQVTYSELKAWKQCTPLPVTP